jgi:hypothetical protein
LDPFVGFIFGSFGRVHFLILWWGSFLDPLVDSFLDPLVGFIFGSFGQGYDEVGSVIGCWQCEFLSCSLIMYSHQLHLELVEVALSAQLETKLKDVNVRLVV